jgi:hypothetical protein
MIVGERLSVFLKFFVYYESIKRKLKTKYMWGCRCYERLQPNTKEFTRLAYTYCLSVLRVCEVYLQQRINCELRELFFILKKEEKKHICETTCQ